jgi:hypothetical protein
MVPRYPPAPDLASVVCRMMRRANAVPLTGGNAWYGPGRTAAATARTPRPWGPTLRILKAVCEGHS